MTYRVPLSLRAGLFLTTLFATLVVALASWIGCQTMPIAPPAGASPAKISILHEKGFTPTEVVAWPKHPQKPVSSAFWTQWGDGKAEMSSYKGSTSRYGELRPAEVVLIYVTEPMDRKTWIKSDAASGADRIDVLKLNASLKFLTGLYPYSVMTSVFSPVGLWRERPFAPTKLTLTVQEWCGHVFQGIWPAPEGFLQKVLSYFDSEGEMTSLLPAPKGVLYEDGLLIQLRQIDQPWFEGERWSGSIVPSLWRLRKLHVASHAHPATITRRKQRIRGIQGFLYTLAYNGYTRIFEIEEASPHRLLGWQDSEGESIQIQQTERLPYWTLNKKGDEKKRAAFGLPSTP